MDWLLEESRSLTPFNQDSPFTSRGTRKIGILRLRRRHGDKHSPAPAHVIAVDAMASVQVGADLTDIVAVVIPNGTKSARVRAALIALVIRPDLERGLQFSPRIAQFDDVTVRIEAVPEPELEVARRAIVRL